MSAAATAAGYLYASGRLRGRGAREQEHHEDKPEQKPEEKKAAPPREVRVAVLPQPEDHPREERPRKTPKIEYRTRRRWSAA
jgi:hypothetical protein